MSANAAAAAIASAAMSAQRSADHANAIASFADAMRRAQLMATLTPPPMHQPRMQASVGLLKREMLVNAVSAICS